MPGSDQSSTPPPEAEPESDLSFSVPAGSAGTVITVSDAADTLPSGASPTEVTIGAGSAASPSQTAAPPAASPEGSASELIGADPDAEFIAHIGDNLESPGNGSSVAPPGDGSDLPSDLLPGTAFRRHRSADRGRSRGRNPIGDWFLAVFLSIGILRYETDDDDRPIVQWTRTILIMVLVVAAITAGIVVGFAVSSDGSTSKASTTGPSVSPPGATTPIISGATGPSSGGVAGLTVARNEITFGTPAEAGQVCHGGGTLTITVLVDGVPANTPVALRLSGPGLPAGFTFDTQPNTPTVRSFPVSGAGQWSDDIVSIGGQPPPTNRGLLSVTGSVQC